MFAAAATCCFGFYSYTPPSFLITSHSPLLSTAILSISSAYLPIVVIRQFLRLFVFRYKGFVGESPQRSSITTKVWAACWKTLKMLAPPRLETCDSLLPALPLPSLNQTVVGYLESMRYVLPKV